MTHSRFFPLRVGDQITWLRNFRNKINNYKTPLGYTTGDITDVQADCDRLIYLLETVQTAAQSFAQAITAHLKLMEDGPGSALVGIPTFALPTDPPAPDNVLPGALKRLFAFIANLKTRDGYDDATGQDLGIIGAQVVPDPNAVPDAKADARSGEVVLSFKKLGHLGAWIESQVAADTDWAFLTIATTTYHDTRPLRVAGQPEKRRYRLCFWDGDPTKVWTAVIEVVFGG